MREEWPPGGSGHLILRSEVQSGRELQLLCKQKLREKLDLQTAKSWICKLQKVGFAICKKLDLQTANVGSRSYPPHSLKPRSEVCQERQQGREMVEFWCFLVSVVLLFDFLSKVALLLPLMLNSLFNFAAIFQKDFFKQFLHLTIKQKFFNPYIGDLFL